MGAGVKIEDIVQGLRTRRRLRIQAKMLDPDTIKALERIRTLRNGAMGLIALPIIAAILTLSLSRSLDLDVVDFIAPVISIAIGLAMGWYVRRRSMELAEEAVGQMNAFEDADAALSQYAERTWRDAFAPWLPYRMPLPFRWIAKIFRLRPGFGGRVLRSFLPDGVIRRKDG